MENIDNGNIKWDDKVTASEYASSMGGSQIFLETGDIDFDDSYKYSVFEDFFPFIKCEH